MIVGLEHHIISNVKTLKYFDHHFILVVSSPYTAILQVNKAYISKYKIKPTNFCVEKYLNFLT